MMKLPIALLALALPGIAVAQTAPAKPKNFIYNGSFESAFPTDNLWDGVDNSNFLAGTTGSINAVTEQGTFGAIAMPISVQVGDLNRDGLLDVVTMDMDNYLRVYFNSGTKTEPKFTNAEMVPIYLARFDWQGRRKAMKIALADLNRSGTMDLVIGTYAGEIMTLRNTGSPSAPEYRQPSKVDSLVLNTTKGGNLWANLLAPAIWDWTGSGTPDLLVGEGTYSANAVHLLVNKGNGSSPKYTEEDRFYLAYGDGREQLVPAVVDYNGDGHPDLIVGDRKGTLNLYLSEGRWNKDRELKFSSVISCGNARFSGCIAPAVGDLNGDGLFDLFIGKTNGRVAVAYNQGTKEQPKFGNPVDLKGTDVWKRTSTRSPSDWSADFGKVKGNIYGYVTTVTEAEDAEAAPIPDGKSVLKVGYLPSLNKVIKYAPLVLLAENTPEANRGGTANDPALISKHNWQGHSAVMAGFNTDSNMVIIRKFIDSSVIKPGVNYTLSIKTKGKGVKSAQWGIVLSAHVVRSEAKVSKKGDRGGVAVTRDDLSEVSYESGPLTTAANWSTLTRNLNFKYKTAELNNINFAGANGSKPAYRLALEIRATLTPGDGIFYVDDVQLIERK